MSQIPDFTGEEIRAVVTECPTAYREKNGCHFVPAKTGDSQFFSQFFHGNREQFGTGKKYYDDLLDCLITTLLVQADHELQRNKVKDLNA